MSLNTFKRVGPALTLIARLIGGNIQIACFAARTFHAVVRPAKTGFITMPS